MLGFNPDMHGSSADFFGAAAAQAFSQTGGFSSAPGSMGGYGQHHAPSLGRAAELDRERHRMQQVYKDLYMTDRRVIAGTSAIMRAVYGDDKAAEAIARGDHKGVAHGLGMAINSPWGAPMLGGSIYDMAYGNDLAARSGMMVGGQAMFQDSQSSQALTLSLTNKMEKRFFGGEAGGANLNRTQGFNRTEIGQITAMGAARGVFSGLNAGDVDEGGNITWNDQALNKVNSFVEESSKALRSIKDMFGDRPMQELVDLAEKIGGMSFGAADGPGQIKRRIDDSRQRARAIGVNEQTAMEMQGRSADTAAAMGFDSRAAAFIGEQASINSMHVFRAHQTARNSANELGIIYDAPTMEDMHIAGTRAATSLLAEHDLGQWATALQVAETEFLDRPELREEVRSRLRTGSQEDRKYVADLIERETGMSLGQWTSKKGDIKHVMAGLSKDGMDVMGEMMQLEITERKRSQVEDYLGGNKQAEGIKTELVDAFTGLQTSTRMQLGNALLGGDMNKAEQLLRNDKGFNAMDFTSQRGIVNAMRANPGRFGGQMAALAAHASLAENDSWRMPTKGDVLSGEDLTYGTIGISERAGINERDPAASSSILANIAGGIMGDRTVTDTHAFQYLLSSQNKSAVATVDFDNLTPGMLEEVEKVFGKEMTHGIRPQDGAVLKKRMEKARASGTIVGVEHTDKQGNRTGTFDFAKTEVVDSAKDFITDFAPVAFQEKLLGSNLEDIEITAEKLETWRKNTKDLDSGREIGTPQAELASAIIKNSDSSIEDKEQAVGVLDRYYADERRKGTIYKKLNEDTTGQREITSLFMSQGQEAATQMLNNDIQVYGAELRALEKKEGERTNEDTEKISELEGKIANAQSFGRRMGLGAEKPMQATLMAMFSDHFIIELAERLEEAKK